MMKTIHLSDWLKAGFVYVTTSCMGTFWKQHRRWRRRMLPSGGVSAVPGWAGLYYATLYSNWHYYGRTQSDNWASIKN